MYKEAKVKRLSYILVLTALLAVLVAACGNTEQETDSAGVLDGKALAEERCATCHPYSRVENVTKTPEEWKSNVERMVQKGAQLDEAEQAAVIQYLSEAFPK